MATHSMFVAFRLFDLLCKGQNVTIGVEAIGGAVSPITILKTA